MRQSQHRDAGHLALTVENFGPIIHAELDLRPLTVFVGPSNTGKSYLAVLVYALHQYFGKSRRSGFWMFSRNGNDIPASSKKMTDVLVRLAKRAQQDLERDPTENGLTLPLAIVEPMRFGLDKAGQYLDHEISRCFGVDGADELVRKGNSENARIVFRTHPPESPKPLAHELTIGKSGKARCQAACPDRIILQNEVEAVDCLKQLASLSDGIRELSSFAFWKRIETLVEIVSPYVFGPLHQPSFYLPADRTGMMRAHGVVVGALIGRASMAGQRREAPTPALSGVLADFLRQLVEMGSRSHRGGKPMQVLAEQIETAIGGSVQVSRSGEVGYPYFSYRPKPWKESLPLTNASSMVSELAPVVLYLRHAVRPGNLLVIEEPESHLHPSVQVELIRRISALVAAGVRVIVTTHSEWLLEELANIVRRPRVPEAHRKNLHAGDFALHPRQVGVWSFRSKKRPRGSEVSEIRLDDSGLYESDFGDVAIALHNDWAGISSLTGEKG